jgi:hypothetical protein
MGDECLLDSGRFIRGQKLLGRDSVLQTPRMLDQEESLAFAQSPAQSGHICVQDCLQGFFLIPILL